MTTPADPPTEIDPATWYEWRTDPGTLPAWRPALFLDRDGVLNRDTGYVGDVASLEVLTFLARAVKAANVRRMPVVVVTNQSGIGRGFYGWDDFIAVNRTVVATFAGQGARIDAIYACSHVPPSREASAQSGHPWRKPNPGMLLTAGNHYRLRLEASIMVGDSANDQQAAKSAGLRSFCWVRTPQHERPPSLRGIELFELDEKDASGATELLEQLMIPLDGSWT